MEQGQVFLHFNSTWNQRHKLPELFESFVDSWHVPWCIGLKCFEKYTEPFHGAGLSVSEMKDASLLDMYMVSTKYGLSGVRLAPFRHGIDAKWSWGSPSRIQWFLSFGAECFIKCMCDMMACPIANVMFSCQNPEKTPCAPPGLHDQPHLCIFSNMIQEAEKDAKF